MTEAHGSIYNIISVVSQSNYLYTFDLFNLCRGNVMIRFCTQNIKTIYSRAINLIMRLYGNTLTFSNISGHKINSILHLFYCYCFNIFIIFSLNHEQQTTRYRIYICIKQHTNYTFKMSCGS